MSIVGLLWAQEVVSEGSWSSFCLCPVSLLMVWSCWGSLILRRGVVEAFWASSSCSRPRVLLRLGVLCFR